MIKFLFPVVVLGSVMCAQSPAHPVLASADTSTPSFPVNSSDKPVEHLTLLPSLPPLPSGRTTMLGGTVDKLDRVREELTLRIFGGGHTKILFDGRTHIYVDMSAGHARDLRNGQRVHLDTVLDGAKVFAENIYVLTQTPTGESYGQIVSYTPASGELILSSSILAARMKLQVVSSTTIRREDRFIPVVDLHPGALVLVAFHFEGDGRVVAREISILAEPGDSVSFTGRVTHLDLRAGVMVLEDPRDQKTYEVNVAPSLVPAGDSFREGADVTVVIDFNGSRYIARTLTVHPSTSN